jgi:beta-glucosidase
MYLYLLLLCHVFLFLRSVASLPSDRQALNDRHQKRASTYFSPPYYPTPKGGWVAEWRASYARAQALVAQMTLVEKVNLTTGTGLYMVREIVESHCKNMAGQ